jgi:hypothetical protein
MRPLFRRSRPGVLAARLCKARRPKGVEGAPSPVPREIRRLAERIADGVSIAANRPGVTGSLDTVANLYIRISTQFLHRNRLKIATHFPRWRCSVPGRSIVRAPRTP